MKMVLQRARELEVQAAGAKEAGEEKRQKIITQSKSLGEEFLRLEKFVNVNYTGFHKILKKHDKQVSGGRERERETHIPGSRGTFDVSVQCYVSYWCVPVCSGVLPEYQNACICDRTCIHSVRHSFRHAHP